MGVCTCVCVCAHRGVFTCTCLCACCAVCVCVPACVFVSVCVCVSLPQVLRWCDEGAYLLASQLVDKFQSKEGAQAALWDIEKLQERAPPPLSASPDALSLEFECVLTPQLQVNRCPPYPQKNIRPIPIPQSRPQSGPGTGLQWAHACTRKRVYIHEML